ncbi:MAG: OprD family outer membrane porin [Sulfurovum sp.]|nr:OprD family outer membrane porin [Sulfurovum sp.]
MNKILLSTTILMIMSIGIQAENINIAEDTNTTENISSPVKIKTVRGVLGGYDPMEHGKGQLRAGYITFSEDGASRTNAYALGGHFHINTKSWNGFMVGAEVFTVLNLGVNQDPIHVHGDLFNENGKSFILISQAYLDGKWGNTEIKLGRQILDTPHADSDDIRMMPNYFEAYTITNTDIDDLTLTAGLIKKMAGWENAVNSAEFVNVNETLGTVNDTDGIYYASASYEGIKDLSLNLWYYNYNDIANVIYAEAGYSYSFAKETTLTLGLQYDSSKETGVALLGKQNANTFGVSMELASEEIGVHILAAYNQDNGETGAMGLSLGGGAFFTSMEDQTLDAIGAPGSAWVIGAGFHFEAIGIEGLNAGIVYGNFKADDASLYESNEIDAVIDYNFNDKVSVTAAFASVDFKVAGMEDYDQFRMIANYNF